MIKIDRLAEPEVLTNKKAEWTRAYLDKRNSDPKARPSSKQYAHKAIVERLEAMSHHKCFYCECSTKDVKQEVDHYIECAERPELAFEWSNLYLSCWYCNHKKQPSKCISVDACVDPCEPSVDPSAHLQYDEEYIRSRDDKGLKTIQKYKLDRRELDHARRGRLRIFEKELILIQKGMIAEGRATMNDAEIEHLRGFARPDAPFSLMLRHYLTKQDL